MKWGLAAGATVNDRLLWQAIEDAYKAAAAAMTSAEAASRSRAPYQEQFGVRAVAYAEYRSDTSRSSRSM
jgi:hypothetical protein